MSTVLRLKRLVASHGHVIAAALLVVGLLAFAGAWAAFTAIPTEQVTAQVNQQTVATSLDTRAVVTGNSTLYDQGEVLRNMPVYFFEASPELTLSLNTTVPQGPRVSVTQAVTLEFRATRDGEPFWSENRTLVREQRRTADGLVRTTTTLNLTDVRAAVEQRRSEVSDVGVFHTNLLVRVTYDTGRYSGTFAEETSLVITGRAYWLAEDVTASRTHAETVTRTAPGKRDPLRYGGLAGLGVLALLGAAGTALWYQRLDALAIETKLSRSRYEEWISDGEFPTGTNKKYVRINSLEDLVDIAIDSNKRVLYDGDFDIYAVIDSDIIFYFSTDPAGVDSWLDV